jgi:hypothetical protein
MIKYRSLSLLTFFCILSIELFNQLGEILKISEFGTYIIFALTLVASNVLILMMKKINWQREIPKNSLFFLKLFWFWSLLTFVHGAVQLEGYWDSKTLLFTYLPTFLISFSIFLGINFNKSSKIFIFIYYRIFPLSFFLIPFSISYNSEFYSRFVSPICLFILIIPYVSKKWKILTIAVALTSIYLDLSYRSNLIRLSIPLLLVCTFYFRFFLNKKIMNLALLIIFCIPIVFLFLASTDQFNIFSENNIDYEANTSQQGNQEISNLSADTRTSLYTEVFQSIINNNSSFIIGGGGNAKYETKIFSNLDIGNTRYRSEVGFLNQFLWSGLVGVILYAIILFLPAYYAINKSKNYLCKMIGLFTASRWLIFFLEDIQQFDMNFFFLWFMIGLCLSNKFRDMTDGDMKIYFHLK